MSRHLGSSRLRTAIRLSVSTVALSTAVVLTTTGTAVAGSAPSTSESPELVVVLDSSGSMAETDAGNGQTRMDAAKQAVTDLATSTPSTTRLGLRTYGDGVDSQAPGSCDDTTLRVPVGPVDRDAITQQVQELQPRGDTPIGTALLAAATDFTGTGPQSVVLVSDGEPTCDPDPCPVAAQLADQGIDLRIDVIGFLVDDEARDILQCIADAGGGQYVDAADATELATALDTSALRSFRTYVPTGDPVEGTPTPEGAPTLAPGDHLDTIATESTNHYLVDLVPGQTLRVGATISRGADPDRRGVGGDLLLRTRDPATGDQCYYDRGFGGPARGNVPLTGGLLHGLSEESGTYLSAACDASSTVLLEVEWSGAEGAGELPLELVVDVEQAVGSPPAESTAFWDRTTVYPPPEAVPPTGSTEGGSSFATATLLAPGGYEDAMRLGETAFYKVTLGWGQQLAFRADVPAYEAGSALDELVDDSTFLDIRVFSPTRGTITPLNDSTDNIGYADQDGGTVLTTTHPISWANRSEDVYGELRHASLPGDVYVQLSLGRDEEGEELGEAVPVQLSVGVLGEQTEGPTYVSAAASGPDPSASTSPAPAPAQGDEPSVEPSPGSSLEAAPVSSGDGLDAWLPVLVVLAVVLLLALLALVAYGVVATRRRRAGGA